MIAAGCLSLLIFPIAGFLLGLRIGGPRVALPSAAAGFLIALIICTVSAYALVKASRRR